MAKHENGLGKGLEGMGNVFGVSIDEMLDEIIKSPLNDADKEYLKDSLSEVRKTVTETYQSSK